MAIRNIVTEDDPMIRMTSREITAYNDRLHILLDDMTETMHKFNGCGIAGVQVGVLRRVTVVEDGGELLELINPKIIESEGSQTDTEGCLSVNSRKNCEVERPMKIKVEAFDRFGKPITVEAEGWKARIICHELDHFDGVLFIDKSAEDNN